MKEKIEKGQNKNCPKCGKTIETVRGTGFGAETKTKCGCPDVFATSMSKTGFGRG